MHILKVVADELALTDEVGRLHAADGVEELLHAGVHELRRNDRVHLHAALREAERDVRHCVAQRRAGVVGKRVRRVDEELVGGVVGGGELAELAAVGEDFEML